VFKGLKTAVRTAVDQNKLYQFR